MLAPPAVFAGVILNEINCEATDWVELVNTADSPADVSGWLLTDDPLDRDPPRDTHRFFFPSASTIPAHGALVVEKATGGFPFGISCGDDTIRLADSSGAPVDDIAVPTLTSGADTWGRYPSGTGSWAQTLSTRGAANQPSSGAGGPPADQAAWLFDPGQVVEIDLSLPQASRDALAANPTEYQDGTFSLTTTGGTYGPLAVGVRLKGGTGSFRTLDGKAAFKIKFNHSVAGQRFLGLKKLTLNNMVQDLSMLREALAYEAFRAANVAAPRTGYAFVRVDGVDYGLYLDVETMDEISLPQWFSSTQHLYEGSYGMDVTPGGAGAFEVDEGDSANRADLESLIAAVADEGTDWLARMAPVADLSQMTREWAVEKYLGDWDSYSGSQGSRSPNNFYLHSDGSGRFSLLPWGADQAWSTDVAFDGAGGLMFNECLAHAGCAAMYRQAVLDARSTVAGLGLDARAQSLAGALRPWQERDPRREYSMAHIDAGVNALRAFMAKRPGDVDAWLAPPGGPAAPAGESRPLTPSPSRGLAAIAFSVGRPVLRGSTIATRLALPGPGRLGLRASLRRGRSTLRVCSAGVARTRAGVVLLHCRLSDTARRLRRSVALPLLVRVTFTPRGGRHRTLTRTLLVTRCRSGC